MTFFSDSEDINVDISLWTVVVVDIFWKRGTAVIAFFPLDGDGGNGVGRLLGLCAGASPRPGTAGFLRLERTGAGSIDVQMGPLGEESSTRFNISLDDKPLKNE